MPNIYPNPKTKAGDVFLLSQKLPPTQGLKIEFVLITIELQKHKQTLTFPICSVSFLLCWHTDICHRHTQTKLSLPTLVPFQISKDFFPLCLFESSLDGSRSLQLQAGNYSEVQ